MDSQLLSRLCETPGLPGREMGVAEVIRAALPADGWETRTDRLGNVTAHRPGKGPHVLLLAHMDEVGLIVRRITEAGFLLVERFGGMGVRALPGSRLTLWTVNGPLPAVVGVMPHHLDDHSPLELDAIYVDAGVGSCSEAEKTGIRVGDGLTWASPLRKFGGSRVNGKALDDRLGCLTLITLARRLSQSNQELPCALTLAFVVQEETMLMGGLPVARRLEPAVAIGVDGTLAFDTPDLDQAQSDVRVGAGPTIKLLDAVRGAGRSFVPHWGLLQHILDLSKRTGISLQPETTIGLSTALTPIPYANDGIAAVGLSLPIRYHHSAVEVADLSDAASLVDFLLALVIHPLAL